MKSAFRRCLGSLRKPAPSRHDRRLGNRSLAVERLEDRSLMAAVPNGFIETQLATALSSPTAIELTSDGRAFVAQQNGVIRVIKNDSLLPTPLASLVTDFSAERGLMSIAVDPDFENNHFLYAYYTATDPVSHNRLSRFTVEGDRVVTGSEQVLFELDPLQEDDYFHMGGALEFGKDGKLYLGIGDQQDLDGVQRLDNFSGKVLRLNSDGSIPTDNPFYNTATGAHRAIWALGLRNPYTAAFQPGTGRFFINDVGQQDWEEINDGIAGRNYGWPETEGNFSTAQYPQYTRPFYTYSHSDGVAITGGAFYNPTQAKFPAEYVGDYFFADFGVGEIRVLDTTTMAVTDFATGISFPTNLVVSESGALYYISRGIGTGGPGAGTGQVYKIQYAPSVAPTVTVPPADTLASVGFQATFSVAVSGTAPFAYQWQRNGVDIEGATSKTYQLSNVSLADNNATFSVRVTNAHGSVTSTQATLTVTSDLPPRAQILSPGGNTRYAAGQTFHVVGYASDREDGVLPEGRYVWQVDLHHDEHAHPFMAPTGGAKEFDFTIPTTGHTEDNVWYRIHLTVTDSKGLTTKIYRDIYPRLATVTLATNVRGLSLKLDGQPHAAPHRVRGVVGMGRTMEAPITQRVNGVTYVFQSWSDGATAAKRSFAFPAQNSSYTANYVAATDTYLNALPVVGRPVNGLGPVEWDRTNGDSGRRDGTYMRLNGVTYRKGMGTHASSSITFNLAGQYARFLSIVGIDDGIAEQGSVRFEVWGDGVRIHQSDLMTGLSAPETIDVSVAGVQRLTLKVTDGGDDIHFDHADWADARMLSLPSAAPGAVARGRNAR